MLIITETLITDVSSRLLSCTIKQQSTKKIKIILSTREIIEKEMNRY